MAEQTIELDCAPGWPRPGDLLSEVIKDTGLEAREPVWTCFGNWKWDYSDVPAEQWASIRLMLREHIIDLHKQGFIRYGSW